MALYFKKLREKETVKCNVCELDNCETQHTEVLCQPKYENGQPVDDANPDAYVAPQMTDRFQQSWTDFDEVEALGRQVCAGILPERRELKEAVKYDSDKIRYDLIPALPLQELAKLYTTGAKKYADHNWRLGMDYSRCDSALQRHLHAWRSGQDYDEESKLHHMSAVAFYAMALMEFHMTGTGNDDRYHPEAQ